MSDDDSVTTLTHRLLDALAGGDPHGAAALFAERVDFDIPHVPGLPWIPDVRSRADLEGFFTGLSEHLEPLRFDVETVVSSGNDAVVLGVLEDRVRATGVVFASRFAVRLTEHAGLLTRYHLFEDSAGAARAVGLPLAGPAPE